jgi:hypothetical protein
MLITVAVIMLLASLVVIVLRGVREGANRVESANALRQMAVGYNSYSTDNKQQLMPGYMSPARIQQLGIRPELPNGRPVNPTGQPMTSPNDASSYVWRLSPYLDDAWRTMFVDYRSDEMMIKLADEFQGGAYGPATADWTLSPKQMGISLIPCFGLNSIYLGGDDVHGGQAVTDRNPWDNPGNKLAATRLSDVKNPARIVLFATTAHWAEGDGDDVNNLFYRDPSSPNDVGIAEVTFGYVEVRPPYVDGVQHWLLSGDKAVPTAGEFFEATDDHGRPIGGGMPVARWGKNMVPTAHLEGSVTTEDRDQLSKDMSLWLPEGVGFREE